MSVLEGLFEITSVDAEGKKFDKVSRVQGKSNQYQMLLDVNIELFPVKQGEQLSIMLTQYIAFDANGTPIAPEVAWKHPSTLADKYEYVMNGRVYKFEEISNTKM